MSITPLKQTWFVAKTVLIEAIRRKEIYIVILAALGLSWWVFSIDFFNLEGISKFQREIVLQVMNIAVALTVIALGACQLPREFANKTIYPLMAKPVSRPTFLIGKALGVWLAGIFVMLMFTIIFYAGNWYLGTMPNNGLYLQHFWLQMVQCTILIALSFILSLIINLDAAIVLSFLFWFLSGTMLSAMTIIYPMSGAIGKFLMKVFVFVLPQLSLFDLSAKIIHSDYKPETNTWVWPPLEATTMAELTLYGFVYTAIFITIAYILFRRKPL
ncbi:ABC transporter permease [Candidatus Sumerlaeota bacterium]|nr:ABC transporter permease [Candidatus Sumerlaeota bacterium]